MRKHREHRIDNCQTGGFVGTLSAFMQLWRVFQIMMKKILYLILGPILGVRLILECDLYSNKYGRSFLCDE